MAIDLITANPDENNPATIATEIDLFVQQIKTVIPQMNDAFIAMNFNSTNGTSASSVAIGTGNKSFTTQTGKSYVVGMTLRIANTADETKWMQGEVESYNSGTGALVVNVTHTNGSGTLAAWTISLSARISVGFAGNEELIVHTGNGVGSTNTRVRRLTTISTNVGSSMTYADSATLGGSITINTSGVYAIHYSDITSSTASGYGLSVNSNQLTTDFDSITDAHKLIVVGGGGGRDSGTFVGYLAAGSVLRMHTYSTGTNFTNSNSATRLHMERIL